MWLETMRKRLADNAQKARVAALGKAFAEAIPAFWNSLDERSMNGFRWGRDFKFDLTTEPCLTLSRRLEERFGCDFLEQAIAEFLVFPEHHGLPKDWREGSQEQCLVAQVAKQWSMDWVVEYGDGYAVSLIGAQLESSLRHVEEPADWELLHNNRHLHPNYSSPHATDYARLLLHMADRPEALDPLERLLAGEWDGPFTVPGSPGKPPEETTRYAYFLHDCIRSPFDSSVGWKVLGCLLQAGRLDYARYVQIYRRFPRLIGFYWFWEEPETFAASHPNPVEQALHGFVRRLGWEILHKWDPIDCQRLHFHVKCRGGHWLLAACERVEALGLSAIHMPFVDYPMMVLTQMMRTQGLTPEEDADDVLRRLRKFSEQTLLAVLPWTVNDGYALMVRALGWENMLPALACILGKPSQPENGPEPATDAAVPDDGTEPAQAAQTEDAAPAALFSNPDSEFERKVPNRAALEAILAGADPVRLKKLTDMLHASKWESLNLMFLEAVAGWNLKALETSIKRGKHTAIAAYGLVPLQRGEAEVLERYLRFKKIAKDSSKYGAERQANTRSTVQAGLANLAQTAGYPDLARLEWDMEAKIGGDGAPLDSRETIGDWEVELALDGLVPQIQIFKQGKPLKSVPAGLRKLERFLAFKDAQANIKAQVGRFRLALEAIMVGGDMLTPDDLRNMTRLPVMDRLLQRLILRGEAGGFGFFDPEGPSLDGLDGVKTPLDGPVCIAHPYHFFQDGALPAWQQAVVKRRIVQPFKQAFRELYILTPAEQETAVFSNRFAGHALKSPVASRLLQTRGWRITGDDDHVEVYKAFGKAGLSAEFDFPDAYRHLTFMDEVVSDQIRFRGKDKQPVALKDVPPLVFSEVMRDADLVVSVAQLDGQASHWSTESYQRRSELISALLVDLGLKGVRCEGHFAYITGKRANYRVHLGSAVIHIEPGNYLCVVPDRSESKRDSFFLPFADAEPKTSEVISKILLLANDSKIKDPSILAQIDAAGRVPVAGRDL